MIYRSSGNLPSYLWMWSIVTTLTLHGEGWRKGGPAAIGMLHLDFNIVELHWMAQDSATDRSRKSQPSEYVHSFRVPVSCDICDPIPPSSADTRSSTLLTVPTGQLAAVGDGKSVAVLNTCKRVVIWSVWFNAQCFELRDLLQVTQLSSLLAGNIHTFVQPSYVSDAICPFEVHHYYLLKLQH